ncbi:MAG TPA: hypothetical protein VFR86_16715 [Burkholderiaceae bacterium]|nr:hypothetical protein [Burkholderiaceae bacterium]
MQGAIHKTFSRYTMREIFSTKRQEIQESIETQLTPSFAGDGIALRAVIRACKPRARTLPDCRLDRLSMSNPPVLVPAPRRPAEAEAPGTQQRDRQRAEEKQAL